MITVGSRIRSWRESVGWSQRELGAKVGLTQAAIHNYETDQRQPSLRVLAQIAHAFGRSRDELLSGTASPDIDRPPVDLLTAAGYGEDLIAAMVESWGRQTVTTRLSVLTALQDEVQALQTLEEQRRKNRDALRTILGHMALVN